MVGTGTRSSGSRADSPGLSTCFIITASPCWLDGGVVLSTALFFLFVFVPSVRGSGVRLQISSFRWCCEVGCSQHRSWRSQLRCHMARLSTCLRRTTRLGQRLRHTGRLVQQSAPPWESDARLQTRLNPHGRHKGRLGKQNRTLALELEMLSPQLSGFRLQGQYNGAAIPTTWQP